jgi:predicted porin
MKVSKLFVAALLVALPLLGTAQDKPAEPAVQIYGTLNVNLQYTSATGATDPADVPDPFFNPGADVDGRMAVSTDSSNIGFRGALAVAHELKAIYQCETSAGTDGEGAIALCNRNSRVGISGSWGTLFYGNWDTPFKAGHYGTKANDPFGNTDVYGFQGVLGSPGFGTRSSAYNASKPNTASFDQRAANSVAYWSPKFSGVSFKLQYSVNEFKVSDDNNDATHEDNPQLIAGVVNFDAGGLSVGVTAEMHKDSGGLGRTAADGSTSDLGWRVFAGYELPLGGGALTVMGMFEQLTYSQDSDSTGDPEDFSRMAWLLGAKFRTGNHELLGRFSQALSPTINLVGGGEVPSDITDEMGAMSYALGYQYYLAKATSIYAYYTQIMNGELASYTFGVAGAAAVVGTNTKAGSDPMAAGLGIRMSF